MKNNNMILKRIISEIREELNNLLSLKWDYQDFLNKYQIIDKYLLRAKASFLADFYMGVERIFKIIAEEINGGLPKGEHWHKRLLQDASIKIDERSAVISKRLYEDLLKFLGFRHVVRQAYGFELNEKKLEELASIFDNVVENFIIEINQFCNLLREEE
ncbi:MAG: hypothetical protein V1872_09085 [bacterium]